MSYCRWSTNDFDCDLYCYEDVSGGWTTHVAGNRVVGVVPPEDMGLLLSGKAADLATYMAQHKARRDFLDAAEHKPIGLPHDGATFNDPTLETFRARVVSLREIGYHCPGWVLDDIDDEIAERDKPPQP